MKSSARVVVLLLIVLLPWATRAFGQPPIESVGERALGMAGAFVAVADDATAVHWNPAGLAAGGPAGMTIGWYRFQNGNDGDVVAAGPERRNGSFTSLGTWPIGLSYGRFQVTRLQAVSPDGTSAVTTARTSQYGVTILQSLVEGVVVGSTLKYVRGEVGAAFSRDKTVDEALKFGESLEGERRGVFDLDLGVMADLERLRVGVTWKNLTSPVIGDEPATSITLPRQGRLGVAFLPTDGLTLAMDVDLDTVDLRGDLRRMLALGGEGHLGSRLAVRTGLRWSLEGPSQRIGAVGMSVSIRPKFWIDGHYAQGRHDEDREFGVALRAGL